MTRGRSVLIRNAGLTFSTYPASGEFWGIKCRDHISDTSVLEFAGIPSMFSLLNESHLCWLSHVRRMDAE